VTTYPDSLYKEIMDDALHPEIYSSRREATREFQRFMSSEAFGFRKVSDIILSAIVGLDWKFLTKDEGEWVSTSYWVHPRRYIRQRIGKPLGVLDHNVAAVVYES
jgi:hypothetical protein